MMCGKQCKIHLAAVLAMFGAVMFILSFLWAYVVSAGEVREFYVMMLQTQVLGFTGLNFVSFILGLIQWSIWGFVFGAIIQGISSCCKCMKGGKSCGMKGGCACEGKGCAMCQK